VKIEFDREPLVVAFEIRILGRMPGSGRPSSASWAGLYPRCG
jgi:hypothetical protein